MLALKLIKPQDDPVYLFLLKKEQEGKHFNVANMAPVNKFLRIYYSAKIITATKIYFVISILSYRFELLLNFFQ